MGSLWRHLVPSRICVAHRYAHSYDRNYRGRLVVGTFTHVCDEPLEFPWKVISSTGANKSPLEDTFASESIAVLLADSTAVTPSMS